MHGSLNEPLNDNTTADVQQLRDSPESVAKLIINRHSKSDGKSSQAVLHSRIARIIQKGQFSEEHYKVLVENNVEHGRNVILLKTLNKIPEQSRYCLVT